MHERTVVIPAGVGLHARPASRFVEAAAASGASVTIAAGDAEPVDATSILSVLGLDVHGGDTVTLRVEGDDAERVAGELAAVLEAGDDA